jgi:ubiquinone/menaquinone biosynthesis C-methylase UbiE
MQSGNERVYSNGVARLRSPERIERLELGGVTQLCLQGEPIGKLLDVGTGSGLFAESFARHGVAVTGVDINPEMIEAATKHVPGGKFFLAPAEHLPFADGSFDACFFGVVFHEVDDYVKTLREAFRVARGSAFILEWPYRQEEAGPPIEHRLKEESIRAFAQSAGYKGVEIVTFNALVLYRLFK